MNLSGPLLSILGSELPHEVMHTVLATHFGKPIPRWVDEGIALLSESAEEQASHDVHVRELLNAGRCIRLKTLFALKEYPRDMMTLYAQGHSVCRFLLARPHKLSAGSQHTAILEFARIGAAENTAESWNRAAKDVYGFESVTTLEEAWLAWLAKPESQLKSAKTTEPTKPKDDKPDLIPPTKLPGGGDGSPSTPSVPYPGRP
jgi:hypothetical protein